VVIVVVPAMRFAVTLEQDAREFIGHIGGPGNSLTAVLAHVVNLGQDTP
jgi:hypothetical protein